MTVAWTARTAVVAPPAPDLAFAPAVRSAPRS